MDRSPATPRDSTNGIRAYIFKPAHGDCSNGGISARVSEVTVVGIGAPIFPATEDAPAVLLTAGPLGTVRAVPAEERPQPGAREVGPMFGGCYIAASDGRFSAAVERILGQNFYGAVALHDRYESQELNDLMS